MSLTLIDRFHSDLKQEQQAALDAGRRRKRDELALLEPEQLRPLASFSLLLLLIGAVFFIALNVAAYYWQQHTLALGTTFWGGVWWFGINVLAYILVLPLHELVHALAFLFWGGKPHFGAKLPLALYCGAQDQLFRRNQYLVIGLAPLVVITLIGIVLTLFAPVLASYLLFAQIGNISGAAGDVWTVLRLLRQPSSVLVEDTAVGYRAWEISLD
ncbi:MAG TPA: DUF3267 domain-containing protein [Ktedonobacteraceae bacterium]|nr:DUF3267 domain-containing protein [Ktedonobacteraceae bacterium]